MNKVYCNPDADLRNKTIKQFYGMDIGKKDIHDNPIKVGSYVSFSTDNVVSANKGEVIYNFSKCAFVVSINTKNLINGFVPIDNDLYNVEIINNI